MLQILLWAPEAFLADLQSGPGSLPLYTEEWVEELLSRVFGILGNLEAPQTRSDHAAVQGNASSAASHPFCWRATACSGESSFSKKGPHVLAVIDYQSGRQELRPQATAQNCS